MGEFILEYYENYCYRFGPRAKPVSKITRQFLTWVRESFMSFTRPSDSNKKSTPFKNTYLIHAEDISKGTSNCFQNFNYITTNKAKMEVFNSEFPRTGNYKESQVPKDENEKCDRYCLGFYEPESLKEFTLQSFLCDFGDKKGLVSKFLNNLKPICEMELPENC